MNILAIDTSSRFLSLGLSHATGYDHSLKEVGNAHTEFLIPTIQALLQKNHLALNEIDAIAYNQGPGSFTGLRIGLSVALGVALGQKIKLIPIPSFALYANWVSKNHPQVSKLLIGLDARLNQIYLAGMDLLTHKYFLEPCIVNPETINFTDGIALIGNGFKAYNHLFQPNFKTQKVLDMEIYPDATYLLDLAKSGHYLSVDPEAADLIYLRDKVALNLAEQKSLKSVKNDAKH